MLIGTSLVARLEPASRMDTTRRSRERLSDLDYRSIRHHRGTETGNQPRKRTDKLRNGGRRKNGG